MTVATPKLRAALFSSSRSLMPTARPMPMMGPMSGEMSMAPMMTAVELTLSPSDAMKMAKTSTQRFGPVNVTPCFICKTMSASFSMNCFTTKCSFRRDSMLFSFMMLLFFLSVSDVWPEFVY